MTFTLLDGKATAHTITTALAKDVMALRARGITAGLAVVLVGDNPASHIYVRNKVKQCAAVGIASFEHRLPATVSEADLLHLIAQLNNDTTVHGILVQLPLPAHIDGQKVLHAINPAKDVDGFHPMNVGKLLLGEDTFVPCTPQGCLILLQQVYPDLSGKHAVVIGRSSIVGKPMAMLLLNQSCTVSIGHSRTKDLPALCRTADIMVAAVGVPNLVQADWVKDGAVVIDVGINRLADGRLCGDVDFAAVSPKTKAITPVPGGVGPMTIACLLKNTVKAALDNS
jgi:methylenetetrahydrofolate dehydrogenase (NADP+)/methenyltetrahydrofolate cyclohydrolase